MQNGWAALDFSIEGCRVRLAGGVEAIEMGICTMTPRRTASRVGVTAFFLDRLVPP